MVELPHRRGDSEQYFDYQPRSSAVCMLQKTILKDQAVSKTISSVLFSPLVPADLDVLSIVQKLL